MNVIIFSRDRACQLDLFFRSFKYYVKDNIKLKVLYTFSDKYFEEGYKKVKEYHPEIEYVLEKDFKNDIINNIDTEDKYTTFFVDDIIFKNYFSLESPFFEIFRNNDDILCLSLRLHPRLTYCYTARLNMTPPKMVNNTWEWRGNRGDFGYPMSVDGHIFRTNEILPKLKSLNYRNPNSLESVLVSSPINKPKMICCDNSVIINNPCNKVQINNPNRHGDINPKYLNDNFINGYIIDLEPYKGIDNESCHKELPVKLIKK